MEAHHKDWLFIAQNKTLKDFESSSDRESYFYARIGWKDHDLYDQLTDLISVHALTKILNYDKYA